LLYRLPSEKNLASKPNFAYKDKKLIKTKTHNQEAMGIFPKYAKNQYIYNKLNVKEPLSWILGENIIEKLIIK
jgi:hypothetical protein